MAAVRLPGYGQAAGMLASAWIFDDVAALQAPTVVLCGAHDRITPPEQTQRVADAVPQHVRSESDMVLIADAGRRRHAGAAGICRATPGRTDR